VIAATKLLHLRPPEVFAEYKGLFPRPSFWSTAPMARAWWSGDENIADLINPVAGGGKAVAVVNVHRDEIRLIVPARSAGHCTL